MLKNYRVAEKEYPACTQGVYESHGHDGSEWWEFKTLPIKPDKKVDELAIFE